MGVPKKICRLMVYDVSAVRAGVIKIYTPRKYGHPGMIYSRDFGDPSVIIGTPLKVHGATGASGTVSVLKTCQMQDGKVGKSGAEHKSKQTTACAKMGGRDASRTLSHALCTDGRLILVLRNVL